MRRARAAGRGVATGMWTASRPARRVVRGHAASVPALHRLQTRTRSALLQRRIAAVSPLDLLVGGENRMSAKEYALATKQALRPSTRFVEGPHVALLRAHLAADHPPTDEALRETEYVANGLRCVEATGNYFNATDEAGVLALAREFLAWAEHGTPPSRQGGSVSGDPIRVRRVRHSDRFQIVDGHHRAAIEVVRGATMLEVAIEIGSVTTPLQDLLSAMSWTEGKRELYQPIAAPELEREWPLVRNCRDRLEMMRRHLWAAQIGCGASYLDVGACYGWFVSQLAADGFDAAGVELDPRAPELASWVYGLEPDRITTGEASAFLATLGTTYDVVSCFSVLHHFVLGRGPCSAEELIRLLDRATGQVLFFDTGEAHEAWFAEVLPEWDPDHIEKWLRANTTFADVIRLGVDDDARGPYAANYGRTLFACVR
jgi:hypothetical protein